MHAPAHRLGLHQPTNRANKDIANVAINLFDLTYVVCHFHHLDPVDLCEHCPPGLYFAVIEMPSKRKRQLEAPRKPGKPSVASSSLQGPSRSDQCTPVAALNYVKAKYR